MPPKSRRQCVCSNWGWEVAGGMGRGEYVGGWRSREQRYSASNLKRKIVIPEYV